MFRARTGPATTPRPTHFLALPLCNHSTLRTRVAALQRALFDGQGNPLVRGLDRSIVIDPRRLHLTLGVMALDGDDDDGGVSGNNSLSKGSGNGNGNGRSIADALQLLESLKPDIRRLLGDRRTVKVKLDKMDVLKYDNRDRDEISAHVLYLGIDENDEESVRLKNVCDVVHQAFKRAGYITDTRPLKLHCTILNTTYRRPRRHEAFSYTDILKIHKESIGMGTYDIGQIELWVMGSHGPNNEYVGCGGISL